MNITTGKLGRTPLVGPIRASATLMPGGLSSLSASGEDLSSGVIWTTLPSADPSNPDNPRSLLIAYDAATLNVLWETWLPVAQPVMSHRGGPIVADGKLVVPTWSNALLVYGLGRTPALSPTIIQPYEQSMKLMKIMDRDRFNLTTERLQSLAKH